MPRPKRITYAQTGQDVLAEFLLVRNKKISPKGHIGTYIDVGACYPKKVSNTYFFYERGWSGVCADANPDTAAEFTAVRPNDHFASVAISDKRTTAPFYIYSSSQLNSFDPARKKRLSDKFIKQIDVPCLPLTDLIDESPLAGRTIDLLSIDTEGHEINVLKSLNFERYKPSLILFESIMPVRQALDSDPVKYLLDQGYTLAAHTGHDAFMLSPR